MVQGYVRRAFNRGELHGVPPLHSSGIGGSDLDLQLEAARIPDLDERIELSRLDEAGIAQSEIARIMGRHPSTIGRELKRNSLPKSGYKPATVVDFEIPKKYGLRQTIADTLGIGGIMRGLGRSGIDLTRAQFVELWVNDFISDPAQRSGTLHIDFGEPNYFRCHGKCTAEPLDHSV